MKRHEFEHILRASAAIIGETDFIVIGSQALLGACPEADGPLALSMEADLYSISGATAYFDVEPLPSRRDWKSGAKKPRQVNIEAERLAAVGAYG